MKKLLSAVAALIATTATVFAETHVTYCLLNQTKICVGSQDCLPPSSPIVHVIMQGDVMQWCFNEKCHPYHFTSLSNLEEEIYTNADGMNVFIKDPVSRLLIRFDNVYSESFYETKCVKTTLEKLNAITGN